MNTGMKNAQIQALRGFACILLVLYHVVGDSPANGLRITEGPVRWLNDGLAYLRMPLLTFLSGWVYGLRPFQCDLTHFMAGKARRLLVPMLFVGTIFALMQAMVPGSNAAVQNWYFLHIEPVAHFWYLESLLWIFLGVALLDKWGQLGKPWRFGVWSLGVVVLHMMFDGTRLLGIEGAVYLAPYFLLGLLLSRFDVWHLMLHKAVGLILCTVAVALIYNMGWPTPNPDRTTLSMLLVGLSLCVLVLRLPLPGAWWIKVGASSYAIYLFHVFLRRLLASGLKKWGCLGCLYNWYLAHCWVLSVPCGWKNWRDKTVSQRFSCWASLWVRRVSEKADQTNDSI